MAELKTRILVDASVLVAATLSRSGGSRVIFDLAKANYVELLLTVEIVNEARLGIKKKYGQNRLVEFYNLLAGLKENILTTPTSTEMEQFTEIISDQSDRHVLAAAKKYTADVLITLDRRHFFTDKIKRASLPFEIQLPADFLNNYRQELV